MTIATQTRFDSQTTYYAQPSTTKSLLLFGIIAGPLYVTVSVLEAILRPGFDLTRHSWSLLANGSFGWIHVTNLIVTGALVIAAAIGIQRAQRRVTGSRAVSILISVYGVGLVGAGIFTADPTNEFPIGTPAGPTTPTWHGLLHLISGGLGFLALITACFIVARQFKRTADRGWMWFSTITGIVFFGAFAGVASAGATPTLVVLFTAAVILASAWLSLLSARLFAGAADKSVVSLSEKEA